VLSAGDMLAARKLVAMVPVAPAVMQYAARLVLATSPGAQSAPASVRSYVKYGSSPRGAQALLMCAKFHALAAERYHVALEDVRRAVLPALRHRLILNFEGEAAGLKSDAILDEVLKAVAEA
jgi:MoxR-like ATPase